MDVDSRLCWYNVASPVFFTSCNWSSIKWGQWLSHILTVLNNAFIRPSSLVKRTDLQKTMDRFRQKYYFELDYCFKVILVREGLNWYSYHTWCGYSRSLWATQIWKHPIFNSFCQWCLLVIIIVSLDIENIWVKKSSLYLKYWWIYDIFNYFTAAILNCAW